MIDTTEAMPSDAWAGDPDDWVAWSPEAEAWLASDPDPIRFARAFGADDRCAPNPAPEDWVPSTPDPLEGGGWSPSDSWYAESADAGLGTDSGSAPAMTSDSGLSDEAELDSSEITLWRHRLMAAHLPGQEAALIDLLRALEDLKSTAAALQAKAAVAFDTTRRQHEADRGIALSQRGKGTSTEIALARRESPFRGGRLAGLAKALVHELPQTLHALANGTLNEWRATLIARETACLDPDDRAIVDTWLGHHLTTHPTLGDKRLVADIRRQVLALDQAAFVRRRATAAGERRVTIRPLPDGMVQLTAYLPLVQGIAVYAALLKAANHANLAAPDAGGTAEPGPAPAAKPGAPRAPEPEPEPESRPEPAPEPRSRGAVMADTLVEWITGRRAATPLDYALMIVITDQALLNHTNEPAHVDGYGPMPAHWVRDLLTHATDPDQTIAIRRLFQAPGRLITMETARRTMTPGLRQLIRIRDHQCRTPWCNAPIRHDDHVRDHTDGGPTSYLNGQGLCEACNYTKQNTGWHAHAHHDPDHGHTVALTTPTGHTYRSTQPTSPGH